MNNRFLCALICLCLLSGCGGKPEAAERPGAAYFQTYYKDKETPARLDPEELQKMASSTHGSIVDTEELTIEVEGALFCGNTVEIALRVTAKELDSVLDDKGVRYKFGDESAMLMIDTLARNCYALDLSSSYCDTDESLAPNQFLLHYRFNTRVPLEMETLTVPLQDFGHFNERWRFVPLYEGDWQVPIAVDPAADLSRHLTPQTELTAGDYRFTVEDIRLTPLSCFVRLHFQGDDAFLEENAEEIAQLLADGCETLALLFADGEALTPGMAALAGSAEDMMAWQGDLHDEYYIGFCTDAPTDMEKMASLKLFGTEISLQE